MIGEIGGWLRKRRLSSCGERSEKPIVGFIAGGLASGRMGHAGAIISGGKGTLAANSPRKAGYLVSASPASGETMISDEGLAPSINRLITASENPVLRWSTGFFVFGGCVKGYSDTDHQSLALRAKTSTVAWRPIIED